MCNLYSLTKGQDAIRQLADVMHDHIGNQPSLPGIFPDYAAPIVRLGDGGERELHRARWGMPSPVFAREGRKVDKGVTNVRNTASAHWRRWLAPASRCLVPFTAFSEPTRADGVSEPVWFAIDETRPLAFLAGIWTSWTSVRNLAEGQVTCDLFAFLTTYANAEVREVHPKAMPVILTDPADLDTWLSAPWPEAAALQRPLADGSLSIVARGTKRDDATSGPLVCATN